MPAFLTGMKLTSWHRQLADPDMPLCRGSRQHDHAETPGNPAAWMKLRFSDRAVVRCQLGLEKPSRWACLIQSSAHCTPDRIATDGITLRRARRRALLIAAALIANCWQRFLGGAIDEPA
jgi:hypothetical protein